MRIRPGHVALIAALVILSGAWVRPANADIIIELGDFSFGPGGFAAIPFELTGELSAWTVSFQYDGNSDGSWSADATFAVLAPIGTGVEVGGRTLPLGFDRVGDVGKESGQQGSFTHYFDGLDEFGVEGSGVWILFVANGWDGGHQISTYRNVVFTLHGIQVIPGPGALALLGLAGLVGRCRRRGQ